MTVLWSITISKLLSLIVILSNSSWNYWNWVWVCSRWRWMRGWQCGQDSGHGGRCNWRWRRRWCRGRKHPMALRVSKKHTANICHWSSRTSCVGIGSRRERSRWHKINAGTSVWLQTGACKILVECAHVFCSSVVVLWHRSARVDGGWCLHSRSCFCCLACCGIRSQENIPVSII